MVILNFTVPFALKAIPKGLKKRTMRPVRENPNSVWNRLYQKWNRTRISIEDYCSNNPNPTYIHKKIELQLWWQQRSRKWHCPHCGIKTIPPKEIEVKVCETCGSINIFPEAHKLADAVLTNMTKRTLGSLTEEEWLADGFDIKSSTYESSRMMGLMWFAQTYKYKIVWDAYNKTYMIPAGLLNLEVFIIEWELV
jgi:ribosomal protein L37AE/L43A